MNDAEPLFTAAEIGNALGRTRFAVARALAPDTAPRMKLVKNNLTAAWRIADLPGEMRAEIERLRARHFYRTAEDVILNPVEAWQPPIPLARIAPEDILAAQKLQRALSRAVALPEGAALADRVALALPDYAREVGHKVTERHLGRLIARTLDRDRRAFAFARLEIYLPDEPRQQCAQSATRLFDAHLFASLDDAFGTLENRQQPTPKERAYCWRVALEWLDEQIANGTPDKLAKAQLRRHLAAHAPFMGRTENAVRVALDAKLAALAKDGEAALFDRRAEKSGRRAEVPDFDASVQLLAKQTRIRHGRVAQAWRELYLGTAPNGWQFSAAFRDYYAYDVRRDKSAVPRRVMQAVAPMIAATNDLALGPRAARLRQPSVHRDWSKVQAGEWHTADDVTINHYWFEWSEGGDFEFAGRRFNVGRGQWLLLADERTDFPIGFSLLPTPSYSGRDIKTLCVRAWMDERIGLPFCGATFERGIWKSLAVKSLFSWPQIDEGFARAGIKLRVRHATTPKAKIIERIIGTAQNMMDHLPGYVGRDEKKVRYERVQKFLQTLKRAGQPKKADVDPREMLLEKEVIADELENALRRFAEEPQNGERLPGISPAEGWRKFAPAHRAHTVLPESLRYLLATDRSEQKVTHEGIMLRVGGPLNYYSGSERLGELRDEKVEVYFNAELPEYVTVLHRRSDPCGLNPFFVPLDRRVSAFNASPEEFAAVRTGQKEFGKYGRATFRFIAPPLNATVRNENLGTVALRATGEAIARVKRETIELTHDRQRSGKRAVEGAARLGMKLDASRMRNPAKVAGHIERAAQLHELLANREASANPVEPSAI